MQTGATNRHRYLAQLLANTVLHDAPQVDAIIRSLWDCATMLTHCCVGNCC